MDLTKLNRQYGYKEPNKVIYQENGLWYKDPIIEELTKDDILSYLNEVRRSKPVNLPVDLFHFCSCEQESCNFRGLLFKKQRFCPVCLNLVNVEESDIEYSYESIFQQWQKLKNSLEKIINGDIQTFVKQVEANSIEKEKSLIELMHKEVCGEEPIIDDPIIG